MLFFSMFLFFKFKSPFNKLFLIYLGNYLFIIVQEIENFL